MGTIVGVIVGYVLGTRAGEQGWEDFRESWKVISSSEEVRDMVGAGFSMARQLVGRGGELLAGAAGSADGRSPLRPVA
jgi:hypothetical protein